MTLAATLLSGCGGAPATSEKSLTTAAPSGSYAFWPQFPDEPRIQFIRSFGTSDDVAPAKSSGLEQLVFGKDAPSAAIINKPYGVAMKNGKIYVCDMRSSAVTVLDLRKKQTRLIGVTGVNRLSHPVAVAVADDGEIYVADNDRNVVMVFDASEKYSRVIGFDKFKPVSVAVHGDRLYACDMAGQAVQIFDRRDGKRLGTIGGVGDSDGQFRVPLGVATDPQGNVIVVDMMRCRVQKFTPDGKFISGLGTLGDYAGSFARPKHIAVDSEGIMYIVDAAFQNVQMFDGKDRLLMSFGAAGNFPGAMNLPAGVCVTDDSLDLFAGDLHPGFKAKRLVVVTNQFGPSKVSVYAMGTVREGWTAQQLAAASVTVSSGVGASDERLRLQEAANPVSPDAATEDEGGQEQEPKGGASGGPSR